MGAGSVVCGCVGGRVGRCVGGCVGVCMRRLEEEDIGCLSLSSFLRPDVSLNLKHVVLAGWPPNSQDHLLPPPNAGVTGADTHAQLTATAWVLKIQTLVLLLSQALLPTEPSPQSLLFLNNPINLQDKAL